MRRWNSRGSAWRRRASRPSSSRGVPSSPQRIRSLAGSTSTSTSLNRLTCHRRSSAGSSVPITPRQLEAIIRLAEAGARMRLSEAVTADDAERAVRIVEYWMGKVAGEEGRFDIDIIQTGISQSQREQIISIRDIINELAGPEGVADY